ncbi:MAG: hypothetical protein R2822_23950 [Spirosomataceae bacterium]
MHNGKLAAAIEATNKLGLGKVVVFNTIDYKELKVISVGALPDMVTFLLMGALFLLPMKENLMMPILLILLELFQ